MAAPDHSDEDRAFLNRAIEVSIRVGLVGLLVLWCLMIVRPFIQPVVWGIVIAVAAQPLHQMIARRLGGRAGPAAGLLVAAALLLLIGPTVALTGSLVETATELADNLDAGSLSVPPPPPGVAEWPFVGEQVHTFWTRANENLAAVLGQLTPQLKAIGLWLLSTGATTGLGILMFVIAIVISGVLLANGESAAGRARDIATRLAGEQGAELTELARATVQNVTRGILGVAVIQSLAAGVGLLLVGVPAAGLWALGVLMLAVIQLPTFLVLLPVAVYVFSTSPTWVAVLFAIWAAIVGLADNILKPLLMGRGSSVPTLVIFLGSIGGFVLEGIIGLFTGAVVLSVGYTLFGAWVSPAGGATRSEAASG